jgi:hypothetical protein
MKGFVRSSIIVIILISVFIIYIFINVFEFSTNGFGILNNSKDKNRYCKNSTSAVGCSICDHFRENNDINFKFKSLDNLKEKKFKNILEGEDFELTSNSTEKKISKSKIAFATVYDAKIWGDAGGGSGVGSDEGFAATASHILRLGIINIK